MPNRHVPAWWAQPATGIVGLQVGVPGDQVVGVHAQVAEHGLELVVQPVAGRLVAHLVAEPDAAVTLEGDPAVGPGQVLGRQPEVDGVGGDVAQDPRSASFVSIGFSPRYISSVDLPTIWMLPIGYSKSSVPK